jgi:hypothetical protein
MAIALILVSVIKKPQTNIIRSFTQITRAGDPIFGIYNTTTGQSTGGFNGTFSNPSEYPSKAIDGLTSTKYRNFGINISISQPIYGFGVNTGFFVIPTVTNSSIASALHFSTANDFPERDPITVRLEGSNSTSITALQLGSSWTLLYSGSTGINPAGDYNRTMYVTQQNFSNTIPCTSYRLLVTSKRNISNSVQYSEAQIMGYV